MRKIDLFDISSLGRNHKQCPDSSFVKAKCVVGSLNYPSCSDKPTSLLSGATMWNERSGKLIEVWSVPHQPLVKAHRKGEVPIEGDCKGVPDGDQR